MNETRQSLWKGALPYGNHGAGWLHATSPCPLGYREEELTRHCHLHPVPPDLWGPPPCREHSVSPSPMDQTILSGLAGEEPERTGMPVATSAFPARVAETG